MSDTIYRQAAIDLWDKYHPYIATKAMAYDRELRALPAAQQWIPVAERLPDKECFVLVTVNDGAIYTDLSLFRNDGRFIEHTGDVVAWMPLPEPYQEDET